MELTRRDVVRSWLLGSGCLFAMPSLAEDNTVGKPVVFAEKIHPKSDITDLLDDALEECSKKRLGAVVLPAGEYYAKSIKLRHNTKLIGMGASSTRLIARSRSEASAFLTIDEGPVVRSGAKGLSLIGGTNAKPFNPGQWAFHAEARPEPGAKLAHGGLWQSLFEDIEIRGFSQGVHLDGGGSSTLLPNQFLSFREFFVFLTPEPTGPSMKVTGQSAQTIFQQCQFDCQGSRSPYPTVEIGPSERSGRVAPAVLRFEVCTFQNARYGALLKNTQNVSFETCWFEQLDGGVEVGEGCSAVTIEGCRFANAGNIDPAVSFAPGTQGAVRSNVFAGKETRVSRRFGAKADVVDENNSFFWGAGK
ncbi:Pectate lyase superfamily protein [Hartmannibacter diazotrophicus]|uniref:Pectate lyase superfamily protein n=1 Tax=Hartmannibacter diazotrophicus TaxID=1482074 RepID=A0A2C9D359_9HYPH|nr:hypothetical protein [Hartmannibacter diazotrophicus]SON54767.1 Pectate lyase superfamily protein [Hartmannibacter diazotrophicus]